jgi:subtilase family serine protease
LGRVDPQQLAGLALADGGTSDSIPGLGGPSSPSGALPGLPPAAPESSGGSPTGGASAAAPTAPAGVSAPAGAAGVVSPALGAGLAVGATGQAEPLLHVRPQGSSGPAGYTPAQIRHAYGVDQLPYSGAGQTFAIVDAYNAPHIKSDVAAFSSWFGLPQFNAGGPTFSVVNQNGGTVLPDTNAAWAMEASLDVEWAHAIAPQANILLVEANSPLIGSLFVAVNTASARAHVVSLSWGTPEFTGQNSYDPALNKSGVTFTAAAGDDGTGVLFPAASPSVLAVGGTSLSLDANGNRTGPETAWSGSGGGISALESEPGYQSACPIPATGGYRGVPDVAYDADPNTGFYVYDTTPYYGQTGWFIVGGTSAGAPQWAALTALADQGRLGAGLGYLSSNNLSLSPEYSAAGGSIYGANYHDVSAGSNGTGANTSATARYDFVTGLGSPQANNLVPYLVKH